MTRRREEEIREVAAELTAVIDELETAVEALRAMQRDDDCEGDCEEKEQEDPA